MFTHYDRGTIIFLLHYICYHYIMNKILNFTNLLLRMSILQNGVDDEERGHLL